MATSTFFPSLVFPTFLAPSTTQHLPPFYPFLISLQFSTILKRVFLSDFFLFPTSQICPQNQSSSMSQHPLKAVTLTHVRYQKGDQLGHFLAWVSLVPVFISLGGFISHFIFRRELQGMFFAIGLIISQFINEIIKKSVQQDRPETCALLETCDSHGWPSSHSQYMFFFAVYFTLLTYRKLGLICRNQLLVAVVLVWPMAILTMYSRVYLGYHTVAQVFAGAALGTVLGGGWFWIVNNVISGLFPAIEESVFGRFFYVKDTSHIPNVLRFEYENARSARKHPSYKRAD